MKLLIVTSIAEYQEDVVKLLKASHIQAFSSSEIEGFKNLNSMVSTENWYGNRTISDQSVMIFSFAEEEHVDEFLASAKQFNEKVKTKNRVRAVVLDIEKQI